jgi:hypothetical protein
MRKKFTVDFRGRQFGEFSSMDEAGANLVAHGFTQQVRPDSAGGGRYPGFYEKITEEEIFVVQVVEIPVPNPFGHLFEAVRNVLVPDAAVA